MSDKRQRYIELVKNRHACSLCADLVNPSRCAGGLHDSNEIGPWTRWQGNLDADLMVVGQDWGGTDYWRRWEGRDKPSGNPTNENLQKLLAHIGVHVGRPRETQNQVAFFTNLILCLKEGNLGTQVQSEWFKNCSESFFKPLIDIIKPKVILALGEKTSKFILEVCKVTHSMNATLERLMQHSPYRLNDSTVLFPLYHCGYWGVNVGRQGTPDDPLSEHKKDWLKVAEWLARGH